MTSAAPDIAEADLARKMELTEQRAQEFRDGFQRLRDELSKVIVGQIEVLEDVLVAFFSGGHVLLEGVPGLGKTVLVRTLAEAVDLKFSRIQFTPDLMPADITGTDVIMESADGQRSFKFQPGPVFANILLADEINRATPKTQSALLEAMQERHVSVGGQHHPVGDPFLVLATQNPLEMEGTYPLPEAQLDRFLFKVKVPYPTSDELHTIVERTTTRHNAEVEEVMTAAQMLEFRELVRDVPMARDIQNEAVNLVLATHPENVKSKDNGRGSGSQVARYVRYGASPRGLQAIVLAAKIYALLDERYHVARDDVYKAVLPSLRHRVILNFEGEAEGVTADEILLDLIEKRRG